MKLSIPQRDALTVLAHTVQAVEKRNTIPILGNVLLRAENNQLTIRATDLDIEVETSIACEVTEPGATTMPANMLGQIVKKMKADAEITFQQDNDRAMCTVKSGRSRFAMQTLPEADFPDMAVKDLITKFEMPVAEFRHLLETAAFCISTEETRYYLNGIYFHHFAPTNGAKLRAVSTDGHRLALIECEAPEGLTNFKSTNNTTGVIIPRKTVTMLCKVMEAGNADKITVQLSDTRAVFTLGNVKITSKLIDGTFPDYARVVPQGNDKVMVCDREELKDAVDRLATVSTSDRRSAKFALTPGKLTLSVVNPDAGSGTEELDVTYDSDPLEIGFNSKYIFDILDKVESDQAEFRFADPGSPVLITGVNKPNDTFVAMPMRV